MTTLVSPKVTLIKSQIRHHQIVMVGGVWQLEQTIKDRQDCMSAPDFVRESPLAVLERAKKGWTDVARNTLQHHRYPNVFSLGDVSSLPWVYWNRQ